MCQEPGETTGSSVLGIVGMCDRSLRRKSTARAKARGKAINNAKKRVQKTNKQRGAITLGDRTSTPTLHVWEDRQNWSFHVHFTWRRAVTLDHLP